MIHTLAKVLLVSMHMQKKKKMTQFTPVQFNIVMKQQKEMCVWNYNVEVIKASYGSSISFF